jgi:hypothetical protein
MIDMPKFPIRSIYIYRAWGKRGFSCCKVLAAVGDGFTADLLKEVEGLCAWIEICVTGDGTSVLYVVGNTT